MHLLPTSTSSLRGRLAMREQCPATFAPASEVWSRWWSCRLSSTPPVYVLQVQRMLAPASELWLLRLSTRLSSTQPVCCFAGTENCSSRRRGVVPAVELQTVNYRYKEFLAPASEDWPLRLSTRLSGLCCLVQGSSIVSYAVRLF